VKKSFCADTDADFFARRLIAERSSFVAPGGMILVELGHDEAPRVRAIAVEHATRCEIRRDYSGHERVL